MKTLLDKRIALITGKGGVGRSSVTAALAHVAARAGKRVLVAELSDGSTDYSALARLFGLDQLPRTAAQIAPGIVGTQLLSEAGIELFLTSVLKVSSLVKLALGFEPLRRLSMATPSLRELGIFFHLLVSLRARRPDGTPEHELVLVDMPATGHTLALTGLPEVLLRLISRGPIADALREGQGYLYDPARAGAYVVTLPETLPISEALELIEGLERTSIPCGGLIINRLPGDAFTSDERHALAPLLARQPIFGAASFHRLADARLAVARLRAATHLPLIQCPELEAVGPALVAGLADTLATRRFERGATEPIG